MDWLPDPSESSFREALDILDIEFQYAVKSEGAHRVLWGGGYRYARDQVQNTPALAFLPPWPVQLAEPLPAFDLGIRHDPRERQGEAPLDQQAEAANGLGPRPAQVARAVGHAGCRLQRVPGLEPG